MTSTGLVGPVTARVFLLGDATESDTVDALGRSLEHRGVARSLLTGLRTLSGSAYHAVDREIAAAASGLLDLDLGDLLVAGWRKYSALIAAAERTVAYPGSEEVVVLATHRVTSTHRPYVDVLIDGAKIATLDFELTITFDLNAALAVVRDGALVALCPAECEVTATLALEHAELLQRQACLDLVPLVPVRPAIPLLANTHRASAAVKPNITDNRSVAGHLISPRSESPEAREGVAAGRGT